MQHPNSAAQVSRLKITEVFLSLQGESCRVGLPTVFVRLTGCPLRCRWCDTAYAFEGGQWRDTESVVAEVTGYGVQHVTVTGGEPLAQPGCLELLSDLSDQGLSVSLETSGALDIEPVDSRVTVIMDLKAPGSAESDRNRWENLAHVKPTDQIKFVIADQLDYAWSCEQLAEHKLAEKCEVLFSPVAGELAPRQLADWIVQDRLPVRFQIQLHKILWGDEAGR